MSSQIFEQDAYFFIKRSEFFGDRNEIGTTLVLLRDQCFSEIDQRGQLHGIPRSPPVPCYAVRT